MNTSNRPSKLALIGFRYDENSSFMKGPADAPPQIRAAFRSEASNLWSESGVNLGLEGTFFDAGDVGPVPGTETFSLIEDSVRTLLNDNLFPICLGGDHSITYPIIRAVSKQHPGLNILHFDAHPDLYDEFLGNRHSHASPFARIMEEGLAKRLVQVGIRTVNEHQREQAERFGVEFVEMRNWRDDLTLDFDSPVYISFDLDALDPAFAPGVSHREPGGLSTRQAIGVIQRLRAKVVGADIVEFNPRMDPAQITAVVCAKLLKEIAAKMLE
ncbi:MAG TPA: agmatinase [Pyrinomonadaceae bacterium]|nr:agmatinase [Pyrinomonadaceae bacterium]